MSDIRDRLKLVPMRALGESAVKSSRLLRDEQASIRLLAHGRPLARRGIDEIRERRRRHLETRPLR